MFVLDPLDFAERAALDGFRQGIALAAQVVGERAADENSDLLREVERQNTTLPDDLP